ncbi:MAG: EamA family transporter [Lachnospiraceae bacterium]|nr:EamA family transporter [Lachnospiraceae bacterium]
MWFWLSLVSILFWSGSDFFSKLGSKREDKNSQFKMIMAVGLVMGIHATVEVVVNGVEFNLGVMLQYLPVSLLYILAMFLGYIGLRYIQLSLSSPICNSSGAFAAILCFAFLHTTLAPIQIVAVVLITIAIVMLAYFERKMDEEELIASGEKVDKKYMNSFIAIFFPIFYLIIDGLGTFADAIVLESMNEDSANVAYEYTFLVLGIAAAIYVLGVKKEKLIVKRETPKLLAGIFETAGQYAYIFAIGANAIAAAPLISSYCMFSVIWARIFMKEKLTWKQYAMVGLAIVGIVLMGIAEAGE